MLTRSLFVLALVALLQPLALSSEQSIRFFYFINQKLFEVTSFEDGLPKLDKEVERSEAPDPSGLRNFQWQVKGTLPLEAEFAMPIVDYSLVRITPSYRNRHDGVVTEARFNLTSALGSSHWNRLESENMIVVGWVADGLVKEAYVARSDAEARYISAAKVTIGKGRYSGFPLIWAIKNGVAVPRSEQPSLGRLFLWATRWGTVKRHCQSSRRAREHCVALCSS